MIGSVKSTQPPSPTVADPSRTTYLRVPGSILKTITRRPASMPLGWKIEAEPCHLQDGSDHAAIDSKRRPVGGRGTRAAYISDH